MSIECFTMFAFGLLVGWWMCVATWPRFTRRKPRHDRSAPQLTEGGTIRGNGNGGPTTPKPQFLPGRVLRPDGETISYRPITPPPELRQQWINEAPLQDYSYCITKQAAQWGYDQRSKVNEAELQQARDEELEECCEEIKSLPSPLGIPFGEMASNALRAARRPKPPSLKEQALRAAHIELDPEGRNGSLIIRALEALPDD